MAYGYEFQNKENDTLYKGRDLEFVIDDENDLGEVYLDGNLIFQYPRHTLHYMDKVFHNFY